MSYTKPEVATLPAPIAAIQGSTKGDCKFDSNSETTPAAYEADE
jgi:hypothetical protein